MATELEAAWLTAQGKDAPLYVISVEGSSYRNAVVYQASVDSNHSIPNYRHVVFEKIVWVWPGWTPQIPLNKVLPVSMDSCYPTARKAVASLRESFDREQLLVARELEKLAEKRQELDEAERIFRSALSAAPDWDLP